MSNSLDSIEDVEIDVGKFKYVLINIKLGDKSKHIVRGNCQADFHADVYEKIEPKLLGLGMEPVCVGGGRILHDNENKSIEVFGYSMGYGLADHSITADLLKKKYTDYNSITHNNDGY